MNANQFSWVYLIENGYAGIIPAYYGGYKLSTDVQLQNQPSVTEFTATKFNSFYIKQIKEVGVDWDKTKEPESNLVSLFEGTFVDSAQAEFLFGKIVLKNGMTQTWVSPALKISNVFEMMARATEAEQKFKEIFGTGD